MNLSVSPVVLGKGEQEVCGELIVEAKLLAGAGETVHLEGVLDGGVQEELSELGVSLHGTLKLFLQNILLLLRHLILN